MSQELLKQIVELLLPVADTKNWGFTDCNGDFRHDNQAVFSFNHHKMDNPPLIAQKIIDLIHAQDTQEQLRDSIRRIEELEWKVEELMQDKNYRDNR